MRRRGAAPPVTNPRGVSGNETSRTRDSVAANAAGELVANGVLTGVVTTATGITTSVVRTVSLPAAVTQATCDILHLDLGPLNLDLLGLQINLSQIVLDVTAQSGAGNLLGNLLCAVAHLLNSPSALADLLNKILGALG